MFSKDRLNSIRQMKIQMKVAEARRNWGVKRLPEPDNPAFYVCWDKEKGQYYIASVEKVKEREEKEFQEHPGYPT